MNELAPLLTTSNSPQTLFSLLYAARLRYKLSLRDLAEMFLERGFTFTHEAVRDWEARFAPLLADQLRTKRHGQTGRFSSPFANICSGSRSRRENALEPVLDSSFELLVSPLIPGLQPVFIDAM
jgi:hypothetical protein